MSIYQVTRLENGLSVATADMPHMASVSLGLWVGVGGRHEPAELNGVCHYIEHMLFKGTRRRSAREISESVEGIGGYLNAFTSEENTCFYAKARHDRFEDLLEVLMDMFLNSVFDPGEINKERDVIKEELAMYLDQPHHHVLELLNELQFPDHPLGRSLTGTQQTLDRLGRPELLAYLRQSYVAPATLVVAAGRLPQGHAGVVRRVQRHARRILSGTPPVAVPFVPAQDRPRLRLVRKETAQTQLALGIQTCSRHDERRFALRVLSTLLGENMSSRLFQVLREDRGLAYSVQSSVTYLEEVGAFVLSVGLDADKLPQALKLVMRELRRIAAKAPPATELQRAREYLIGQMDLGLEGTENQMTWTGEQLLAYGRVLSPGLARRQITQVTGAQVRAAAADFFRPERMNLAIVSPLKSAKGLTDLLSW